MRINASAIVRMLRDLAIKGDTDLLLRELEALPEEAYQLVNKTGYSFLDLFFLHDFARAFPFSRFFYGRGGWCLSCFIPPAVKNFVLLHVHQRAFMDNLKEDINDRHAHFILFRSAAALNACTQLLPLFMDGERWLPLSGGCKIMCACISIYPIFLHRQSLLMLSVVRRQSGSAKFYNAEVWLSLQNKLR
jgi:hypothetical protein